MRTRRSLLKRMLGLTLAAGLAITGLTACMSDDNSNASKERRSAALVAEGQSSGNDYQLVIDGLTPVGLAIDVESFSWGATNPNSPVATSGATSGKVALQDFHFTKKVDQASPLIFKAITTGAIYKTATLKLFKASAAGKPEVYMTYELSNVLVSSNHHGGGGGAVPNEEIALAYAKLTHTFSGTDEKTGAAISPVRFGWDLGLEKGI
jgi:type VI secretion system secreted protein Hcp